MLYKKTKGDARDGMKKPARTSKQREIRPVKKNPSIHVDAGGGVNQNFP